MDFDFFSDEYFMKEAIKQAQKAFNEDEIPIGAVIVCNNKVIARAHNYTERLHDTTAHAEMQAITAATEFLGAKYIDDCTLYVTVEPCVMCIGAAFWSKVSRIVFGAHDNKFGFLKFEKELTGKNLSLLHPKIKITAGILETECAELMKSFFLKKRTQ